MADSSNVTEAYKLLGYDTTLLEGERKLEDLWKSESFRAASEQLYFLKEGTQAPPLKDGAAYIEYGISKARWASNNIIAGANDFRQLVFKANDEQKVAMLYLMNAYSNTNSTWMGRAIAVGEGIVDPSLLASAAAGIFSWGTGAVAGLAGRTAAVEGLKLSLQEGAERLVSGAALKYVGAKLAEKSVTGAFARGALPGLASGLAQGVVDQAGAFTDIKIKGTTFRNEFSGWQYAESLATSTGLGGGFGVGGHGLSVLNNRFGITDSIGSGLRHLFSSESGMARIRTGGLLPASGKQINEAGGHLASLIGQATNDTEIKEQSASAHAKLLASAWKTHRRGWVEDDILKRMDRIQAVEGPNTPANILDRRYRVLKDLIDDKAAAAKPTPAAAATTPPPAAAATATPATPAAAAASATTPPPAAATPVTPAAVVASATTPPPVAGTTPKFAPIPAPLALGTTIGEDIIQPKFDPGTDIYKFRLKWNIFNKGWSMPHWRSFPVTAMQMESRHVTRPVIEAVDKLFGDVAQATPKGKSSFTFRRRDFVFGDSSGQTVAIVKDVGADSIITQVQNLQDTILRDMSKGAKAIDDFAALNADKLKHLQSQITALRNHVEATYKEVPNTYQPLAGTGIPGKKPSLAFSAGDYAKHGLSQEQKKTFLDSLDDMAKVAGDLQNGSRGEYGQQMLATVKRIQSGELSVDEIVHSTTGLSHANYMINNAYTRLTGKWPDKTLSSNVSPYWTDALANNIQDGFYNSAQHGKPVSIASLLSNNIEKPWQNVILKFYKQHAQVDDKGFIKSVQWSQPNQVNDFGNELIKVFDAGLEHDVFFMIDDLMRRQQAWDSPHDPVKTLPTYGAMDTFFKTKPSKDPRFNLWAQQVVDFLKAREISDQGALSTGITDKLMAQFHLNRQNLHQAAFDAYPGRYNRRYSVNADGMALPGRNIFWSNFVHTPRKRAFAWLTGAEQAGVKYDLESSGASANIIRNADDKGNSTGFGFKDVGRTALRWGSGFTLGTLDWRKPWNMPTKLGWGLAGVAMVGGLGQAANIPMLAAPADATMTAYTTVIPAIPGAHRLTAVLGGAGGGAIGGAIAGSEAWGYAKADPKDGAAVTGGKFVARRLAGVLPGAWEGVKLGWGAGGESAEDPAAAKAAAEKAAAEKAAAEKAAAEQAAGQQTTQQGDKAPATTATPTQEEIERELQRYLEQQGGEAPVVAPAPEAPAAAAPSSTTTPAPTQEEIDIMLGDYLKSAEQEPVAPVVKPKGPAPGM